MVDRVTLPIEHPHAFRYMTHSDYWFDENHAAGHDGRNSILPT